MPAGHLNQVFLSVLQNALQAVNDAGKLVISSSRRARAGGTQVEISIRDNGPGISAGTAARRCSILFTHAAGRPGARASASPSPATSCAPAARSPSPARRPMAAGAPSSPFFFLRPRPDVQLFQWATGSTDATPTAAATPERYRLLIVDDEPGILKALGRVFRQENYDLLTAPSAEEGLELLADGTTHLVISDFMMPGMNGGDFPEGGEESLPETIRIMLTGRRRNAVMGAIWRWRRLQVHRSRGTMTTCG